MTFERNYPGEAVRMCCIVLLAGTVATSTADGDEVLQVAVSPRVCNDPCSAVVSVRHEPHAKDRALIVETDGSALYRSSSIQLNGDAGPATHRLVLKSVPGGEYIVRVSLERELEMAAQVETTLVVVGQPVP
jgi:hypothetical protein